MTIARKTYDHALLLKDAGAVTSSAAGTVSSAAKVLDIGSGELVADLVVDVSALDTGDGNETYELKLEFSAVSGFSPDVDGVKYVVTSIGRKVIPFTNLVAGTVYRYCRIYATLAGTTPSINYTAYIAKR
jgi:hypothetical protein